MLFSILLPLPVLRRLLHCNFVHWCCIFLPGTYGLVEVRVRFRAEVELVLRVQPAFVVVSVYAVNRGRRKIPRCPVRIIPVRYKIVMPPAGIYIYIYTSDSDFFFTPLTFLL